MRAAALQRFAIAEGKWPASYWLAPLLTAGGYYLGAQAAFSIGTLSDRIFAPFWPPNTVLFCALLLTPRSRWWQMIGAAFVAHTLAELQVGMGGGQLIFAFVGNCLLAVANALTVRRLSVNPPWLGSFRRAAIYIVTTAGINPGIVAFLGGFVPIIGGAPIHDYPYFWSTWFVGNALASVTLGPIILTWGHTAHHSSPSAGRTQHLELALFVISLIAVSVVSLELSAIVVDSAFNPAILYLPLPIVIWGAARFGERGASSAILILTVVSISLTLNGHSPFVAERPEKSVLALQLFLIGIAIPILLLSAAIEQLRANRLVMRRLTGSLLTAQDEERRRIARDLHDSTAQNLVAAGLLVRNVATSAGEQKSLAQIDGLLRNSVSELRLLSYVLHPPQLDEAGLGPALASYVDGFSARSGIPVALTVSPAVGRIARESELALYRVAQEALTNIDRHSGSRTASIRLSRSARRGRDAVRLVVEDNGRGIPSFGARRNAAGHSGRGVGLESMRERVHLLGGRLKISTSAGGTQISASIPVSD